MPSITETTDSGFYVTHLRNNVRLSCRCKTMAESEETLRKMVEDVVVCLPRKQVHFLPDKILIIKKGKLNDKKYRNPYIMTDYDFDIQKKVLKN